MWYLRQFRISLLVLVFLISHSSFALDCKGFEQAARFMKKDLWFETSRARKLEENGESFVDLASHEVAAKYVYKYPPLQELGFGEINSLNWTKTVGRMESSASRGKVMGWERKLEDGSWARVRLDFSPEQGAHYNIEVRVPGQNGKFETHKLGVKFLCDGTTCTEGQYVKMIDKMN